MNVMVCFRSGISAAIASSAKAKLQHLELKSKCLKKLGLSIELIYLDKKNLNKVLEKIDIKPDYIYLYEDGKNNENDIREFIEKNIRISISFLTIRKIVYIMMNIPHIMLRLIY